jgi:pilus assembly protein Flp/PilA
LKDQKEPQMKKVISMLKNTKGQGMVEYALIIALVAVALIAGLGLLQGDISSVFTRIGNGLTGA